MTKRGSKLNTKGLIYYEEQQVLPTVLHSWLMSLGVESLSHRLIIPIKPFIAADPSAKPRPKTMAARKRVSVGSITFLL
jgi:hypothetical protein